MSGISTAERKADAKSYLDSIVVTLTIPIPLLMALGLAAYSLATKTGPQGAPTVPISGAKVPFPLAAVMVMVLNSLLLIHVARMTSLLRALLSKDPTRESTTGVLLCHAGMLNPFAGPASFQCGKPGVIGWTISLVPKITVGALIGFYALFVVTIGDFGPQTWGNWFLPVVLAVTLMHTIGVATSMLEILWLNMDLRGFVSSIPYLLGLVAGGTAGYLVDSAIGTAI